MEENEAKKRTPAHVTALRRAEARERAKLVDVLQRWLEVGRALDSFQSENVRGIEEGDELLAQITPSEIEGVEDDEESE